MYARVVIDTGGTSSIESLTYEIPDGLAGRIGVGSCVLVPLASRQAVGYVIGFEKESEVRGIRPIVAELESPVRLTEDMLRLARWVAAQYMCPLPRAVAAMLPGVMHCRLQGRVMIMETRDESMSLTPSEVALLEKIRSADAPGEGVEGPALETIYGRGDRSAVQRALRQLEAKGAVKRVWRLVPPSGKPRVMRGVRVSGDAAVDDAVVRSLPAKQAEAMRLVAELGRDVSLVELGQRYGVSSSSVDSLRRKGFLERVDLVFRRSPEFVRVSGERVTLSAEQSTAVDEVTSAIDSRSYRGHLLFGVTASGKTEVYLRCIEHALARGRTSLVLLPEIALTTQVMNIFKSRFGDQVAVMHSALSAGERCDEWARADEGEARVVLGARSAVFAPLRDLGLVIVDEEHESSYKQDSPPRYNGRDAAIERARDSGAALVLGSATPCIETFYQARQGHYALLAMPSRVENRPMPTVHIADLREGYAQGRASVFSERLEQGIRDRLARGQQVILLQNRRAYSTFLLCRDCGFVTRCPNCAVSLKFYSAERRVSCHHCDYTRPAPTLCPSCQGLRIGRFGIGTERVEEETRNSFPEARVIRMDRDTTSRKGAHASILDLFRRGEADILVGTQMIAKGLDFPNVTLVGVISADTSLNLPDFRASERTFQLVSQVAGRSGRGLELGEVVVQTFDPENYAIKRAVEHDYPGFYEQELEMRRELSYPPFGSLVNVMSRDAEEPTAESRLEAFASRVRSLPMSLRRGVEVIGPTPAVLSKLRGEYRYHLVLRSRDRDAVLDVLRQALERAGELRKHLAVDVDPASML